MTERAARRLKAGRRLSRRFQVLLVGEGALVGLVGGGVVTLYRLALSVAENGLRTITGEFSGKPLLIAAWFAILALVLLVVSRLLLWEPYTQGSGIPQTDAEVIGRIDMPWHRVMAAKFAEGTLCAFAGLSLGREGPSVQLGGMAGKGVSKALKRDRGEERLLVTCGAAAGMSAAFHAPLTGVLFALEEIHKQFNAPLIITVMTASVVSDFLVSQVLGMRPVLKLSFASDLAHVDYPVVVILGILCGVVGALHNKGMFFAQSLYAKITKAVPYARLAIPFAIAGVVAFTFPVFMCGGDEIVDLLRTPGILSTGVIAFLLIGKYLFTTVSFASGAPGGTLFPLVVMGSLLGALFGFGAIRVLGLQTAYLSNFMALGVAGLFAGVVRSPVTAVVLVFELTGSLDSLLSVSIVSILAYVSANIMRVDGFYEYLLAKLLGTTTEDPSLEGEHETEIHTFSVGMGSFMESKLIRDIPWPEGTRVITIDRSGRQIVPTGDTQVMAMDVLLLIMRSETEEADEAQIRQMTRGGVESRWTPEDGDQLP